MVLEALISPLMLMASRTTSRMQHADGRDQPADLGGHDPGAHPDVGGDPLLGPPALDVPALLGGLTGEQASEDLGQDGDQEQVDRTEHGGEHDEARGHHDHLGHGRQDGDQLEAEGPPPALDVGRLAAARD